MSGVAASVYEDPTYVPSNLRATVGPVDYVGSLLGLLEAWPTKGLICEACGCLCHPDEVCPGCRAARL